MNNIFENAYFGKPYKTRDGRKVLLIQPKTCHIMLEDLTEYCVTKDGFAYDDMATCYDIVSEWKEEVNEEELDKLALESTVNFPNLNPKMGIGEAYNKGFKAGFKKAINK